MQLCQRQRVVVMAALWEYYYGFFVCMTMYDEDTRLVYNMHSIIRRNVRG